MHRHVSLIVDIHHARCGACKMAVNELATSCLGCGSVFLRIQSNHAGLALKFERRRAAAGVFEPRAAVVAEDPVESHSTTRPTTVTKIVRHPSSVVA